MKKILMLLLVLSNFCFGQNSYPTNGTAILNAGTDQTLILKDGRTGTNWNYMEWQFSNGSRDWVMGRRINTGYFTLWRDGVNEVLTVDNSGKVGIGTVTPEAKLTITQIGNGWNDGLRINRDASNWLTLTEDVTDIRLRNWGSGGILFYTSGGLVTILNNGNMGVGTGAPSAPLEVKGPSLQDGTIRANSLAAGQSTSIGLFENGARRWAIYNDPGNTNTLFIGNKDGQNKISVTQDGNMGIGTLTPGSFKLAVNGKIWSQEVNVAMTNPGPDYVFEKDYNLLSLAELEAYVKANKHLPEVPSAKEMEADGLNLKEMNLILLKKVEELTLHLIEANKKITETNEKVKALEERVKG